MRDLSPDAPGFELDDKFHDECGLFGIWNHAEAANVTYLGLYALQHRGQESAGIAATDGHAFHVEKAMGWVADVFSRDRLERLPGDRAIGHVRYSTAGDRTSATPSPSAPRPRTARSPSPTTATSSTPRSCARAWSATAPIFQSTSDTEVILHLLARAEGGEPGGPAAARALAGKGAFSLLVLTPDRMVGVRDPGGFRPLSLGRLGEAWVLASETCALDLIEAEFVRDVEPGEMVIVDDGA